jgi:hypothetical protein
MNPLIQLKTITSLFVIVLLLACFALTQRVRAVSPAPDGGYPGGNTAEGQAALLHLTTGGFNTAVGFLSLRSNTTNNFNTAVGAGALLVNTADANTATGAGALLSNTTGTDNMANGEFALLSNTTGNGNTANGGGALQSNTTGSGNTANGNLALYSNTTGIYNTATGLALLSNTTGSNNTATGANALMSNTDADGNTAIGFNALLANTRGSNNIALGSGAGQNTNGDYNIDIGNAGVTNEDHTIRIGDDNHQSATFLAGVYGASVAGLAVVMDSSDHLGTTPSSRRLKREIKPMENASETILALQPVTFRYKKEIDPAGTSQFGLVAEDVEKVNPDLVVRDKEGKPYSVRYDQVNAMLLNEFLKEHRKVEQMQKQIDALTAGLQNVSAQLELNKAAPQTVLNDQ